MTAGSVDIGGSGLVGRTEGEALGPGGGVLVLISDGVGDALGKVVSIGRAVGGGGTEVGAAAGAWAQETSGNKSATPAPSCTRTCRLPTIYYLTSGLWRANRSRPGYSTSTTLVIRAEERSVTTSTD